MKKTLINLAIVLSIMICFKTVKGQGSTNTNIWTALRFLGYDHTTGGPLDIGNGDINPINFYINGGGFYPFPSNPQMKLDVTGFLGIGIIAPQNLLHIDGGGLGAYTQWTNTLTGNAANNLGFTVGIDGNGNSILYSYWRSAAFGGQMLFQVHGFQSGEIDQYWGNTSFGYGTFPPTAINSSQYHNTAFGDSALAQPNQYRDNTGIGYHALMMTNNSNAGLADNNVAAGSYALEQNIDGYGNNAVGMFCMQANKWGLRNTANGNGALESNVGTGTNGIYGNYNVAMGWHSMLKNGTGSNNTAIGTESLNDDTTGWNSTAIGFESMMHAYFTPVNHYINNNVALGYQSLFGSIIPADNTGLQNTAIGYQSIFHYSTGSNNSADGYQTLYNDTSGSGNTACGIRALYINIIGNYNTATGDSTLFNTKADSNTATGYQSLFNNIAGSNGTSIGTRAMFYANNTPLPFKNTNVAVGFEALYGSNNPINNTGLYNNAIGYQTLWSNITGSNNFTNGYQALYSNKSGKDNIAEGYQALYNNTSTSQNVAIGSNTLFTQNYGPAAPWITDNIAIGYNALYKNNPTLATNGFKNIGIGTNALSKNTIGNSNTAIGWAAAITNTVGDSNTFLGCQADAGFNNLLNSSAIGANTVVTASNKMILANDSSFVGIGLSSDFSAFLGPRNRLEINVGRWVGSPAAYQFAEPPTTGVVGYSGLEFRDLTSYCTPITNPSCSSTTGSGTCSVLSVDQHGNVILVPAENGIGFGYCSGTIAPPALTSDAGLNLNDNRIYFQDPTTVTTQYNEVSIGYPCSAPLQAKLDVQSITFPISLLMPYTNRFAGRFYETGNYLLPNCCVDMVGVVGTCDVLRNQAPGAAGDNFGGDFYGSNANNHSVGARGSALGFAPVGDNRGLWGVANNGQVVNYGVVGEANSAVATGINFGTVGIARNSPNVNEGMQGWCPLPVAGAVNVGVYGATIIGIPPGSLAIYGDLGIGCPLCGTAPDYAGYFNGDVATTAVFIAVSDSTLKENIQNISNPMNVLNQLHPKSYTFRQQQYQSMQLPSGTHFGVLAQELEPILPQLVKNSVHPARYDSLGNMTYPAIPFKGVNSMEFIPYLICASKQFDSTNTSLQNQVDSLTAQNNSLQNQLNNQQNQLNNLSSVIDSCCNISHQPRRQKNDNGNGGNNNGDNDNNIVNSNTLVLSSDNIILYQNQPNPLQNTTTVRYYINPSVNFTSAYLIFYDSYGSEINKFDVTQKGNSQLIIDATKLSAGAYSYALVVDSKIIDTKHMVRIK